MSQDTALFEMMLEIDKERDELDDRCIQAIKTAETRIAHGEQWISAEDALRLHEARVSRLCES
jgi:hypothetical protein